MLAARADLPDSRRMVLCLWVLDHLRRAQQSLEAAKEDVQPAVPHCELAYMEGDGGG